MKKTIKPVAGTRLHNPERVGSWHHAATRVGDTVYLSGIVGAFPRTRTLGGTIEKHVRLVFENVDEAPRPHGAGLANVARPTMYFIDRDATWPILDRVRREVFLDHSPTRTRVGVTKLDFVAAPERV